jgi:hypothetical protein
MVSKTSFLEPDIGRGIAREALFAGKIYAAAALVGAAITIGAAQLGHPLYSVVEDPAPNQTVPQPQSSPAPLPSPPADSGVPIAKFSPDQLNRFYKVEPKDPNFVIGTSVYDVQNNFVGQVVNVYTTPITVLDGGTSVRQLKTFVTLKDKDGTPETIDYGTIEWKAVTKSEIKPAVGLMLTSWAPTNRP